MAEPIKKRGAKGNMLQNLIVDVSIRGRNGSLGPDSLYDSFLDRNTSEDLCLIIAEYIPQCTTRLHLQVVERLITKLCQRRLTSSIDSQLHLLESMITNKVSHRRYLQHMVAQSSRFDLLCKIFTFLETDDLIAFGKWCTLLFVTLEQLVPVHLSIQLVLAFIRDQLAANDNKTADDPKLLARYSVLLFRFFLHLQRAHGSIFTEELVRSLPAFKSQHSVEINSDINFFITKLLDPHNQMPSWLDYLSFCSCLLQTLDRSQVDMQELLTILLQLNRTPDSISVIYERVLALTSHPGAFTWQVLIHLEAIIWSVHAHTICYSFDSRFFAFFSSALDTLEGIIGKINITVQKVRHLCFLLRAFIKTSALSSRFRERCYIFLDKRGSELLTSCIFPLKEYPNDTYARLSRTFISLTLAFPEIMITFFLMFIKRAIHYKRDPDLCQTLLHLLSSVLQHAFVKRVHLLTKSVAMQYFKGLEELMLSEQQLEYSSFVLQYTLHWHILAIAGLTSQVRDELVTDIIIPIFHVHSHRQEFMRNVPILSIYLRLLCGCGAEGNESLMGSLKAINCTPTLRETLRKVFALTLSNLQLLSTDTDVSLFAIICEFLTVLLNSVDVFSANELCPIASFLPTICSQIHDTLICSHIEANKREASQFLRPVYALIAAVSYYISRSSLRESTHSSVVDTISPDILRCIRLIPDALDSANIRFIRKSVSDAIVAASMICSLPDIFLILLDCTGAISKSTRLVLSHSVASAVLACGVGRSLPFLLMEYGVIPDKTVKLTLLRTASYIFDELTLAQPLTDASLAPDYLSNQCIAQCTTYMALSEGFVGMISHALAERDGSVRLMGIKVTASMIFSCSALQQAAPLLHHLISMVMPNIIDICDRTLSDTFQRAFEAIYYRFGTALASSFVYAGIFHIAYRVRQAYRLTYDSLRLSKGVMIELLGPNMEDLLIPVPTCLLPPSANVSTDNAKMSTVEWVFGNAPKLDFECSDLFISL